MSIGFEGRIHDKLFPFTLAEKLSYITEPHPWFDPKEGCKSPWGRPVLPPECKTEVCD